MNQKLKQAGLFAILAVFTISLTTSLVADAEASAIDKGLTYEIPELSSKAQHKAELGEKINVEDSSSLQQVAVKDSATKSGMDFVVTGDVATFRVTYVLQNSVDIDLGNVEILVTSDTESVTTKLNGNYDKSSSIISVDIDAVDPVSINAKIIG